MQQKDEDVNLEEGGPHGQGEGAFEGMSQSHAAPPSVGHQQLPAQALGGSAGAVAPQGTDGNQGAQIAIRYADGREEVIHVLNPDNVRSVVKADQIIPALSASYPITMKPTPLQSSSVPQLLGADLPSDDVQADSDAADAGTNPSHLQPPPLPSASDPSTSGVPVSSSGQQQDTSGGAKKKKKSKKAGETEYHSLSAPTINQEPPTMR